MKLQLAVVVAIVCGGVGLWAWRGPSPVVAGIQPLIGAAAKIPLGAFDTDEESVYSYVGSKKCKKCHLKVHKSWAKTKMGKAFETLQAGQATEAKEKFGLDADKDYTKEETCLKCHSTGYHKPGGYAPPDPEDKDAVKTAEALKGVGCESCHGPGSEYIKVFEEIMKSKRTYKADELYAVGLRKIEESLCLECHNQESPTVSPDDTFDYEKAEEKDIHIRTPLKQREE